MLLATTGLTQTGAAAFLGVAGRTVRRWMEGVYTPPASAIERLKKLTRILEAEANGAVQAIDRRGPEPAVLLVYRRDQDVLPWAGARTAGCHLAMLRRVAERRPDVQFVTFNRSAYRRWLGESCVRSNRRRHLE